ncbi:protein IV [Bat mastadenovirus G]|uniref:Protein IV n=1 Tax=Bat mastadenovirus G TaxID=2015376 RepID=A0A1J0FAR5_9ADEN|nr:protein IV [Bat mastadenovirus G]APC26077.1 protein IV [Bat mastadenovirus G]
MKRARALPADYDPVYPYEQPAPPTQPPFFNRNKGLTESPPGTLALNVTSPLGFTNTGQLKVNTGNGLKLDQGNLQVSLGAGLTTNSQGEITLQQPNTALTFTSPLHKNNDEVSLTIGDGLRDDNGTLKVTFPPPPPPLSFTNPLSLSNNSVSLQVGAGLQVSGTGLSTVPETYNDPLEKTDQGVNLKVGAGLTVSSGQLQAVPPPSVTYSAPLAKNNNTVSLTIGTGLQIQGNALTAPPPQIPPPLSFSAPLTKNNNSVTLQVGRGLAVQNNALESTAETLSFTAPLAKNGTTVSLSANNGLTVNGGNLAVNVGQGLQVTNGAVTAKIGPTLTFNNGAIEVVRPPSSTNVTLWTGPSPSVNASINGTPVIRSFVCLSRNYNLVTLTANFTGEGTYRLVYPTQSKFSLIMDFDQFGQLISTGNINSTTTWGEKPLGDNTVQAHPSHTWKLCMPNAAVYNKASTPCVFYNRISLDTKTLDDTANRNIDCLVLLNTSPTSIAAYSITFRFLNFNRLSGGTLFITDNISCSFVGENQ